MDEKSGGGRRLVRSGCAEKTKAGICCGVMKSLRVGGEHLFFVLEGTHRDVGRRGAIVQKLDPLRAGAQVTSCESREGMGREAHASAFTTPPPLRDLMDEQF